MQARSPGALNRPIAQYIALAVLLGIAVTYQVRFMEYRFPSWFGRADAASVPFLVGVSSNSLDIEFLTPEATNAGLRQGDTLVAVNGRPLTGTKVYGEALAHAHGGDVLTVTVRAKGSPSGSSGRIVRLKLAGFASSGHTLSRSVAVAFWVVMPVFSILLGFWVAAVRPRDSLAWLLLALMLSFSALSTPFAESWGPGLRDLGAIYNQGVGNLLAFWMMLFAIYFPEPFPAGRRWPWWTWCKWLFGVPLLLGVAASAVVAVGKIESYHSIVWLGRLLDRFQTWVTLCGYLAMTTFFVALWVKSSMVSADSKRRLRLVYAGAMASFTPLLILEVIARLIYHTEVEEYFPEWLAVASYLFMFLFPLTLAYVIVVHKAMNVSVVIRQGLQYALARGGIRVLSFVLAAGVGTVVFELVRHAGNGLVTLVLIAVSVVVLRWLRRLGDSLRTWTDRRFFRDAYQAEQILADLGEQVRGIVETRPLIETVSRRIAESLHVPQVAVLMDGSGPYRPAYALGYHPAPEVEFAETAGVVGYLRQAREPARVYLDDPNSWIYRSAGVSEEERARLAELKSELLLPLAARDHLLGFISLSQKRSEEPYSGTDLRLLKSLAAQTGLALENARLTTAIADEVAQKERLNREVEIAREVQERLFPQKLPVILGLDYFGRCRPALGVGGDYYDFLALPGGRLGIALGDVSGKGIAAALMMASLEASLRAEAMRGTDDLAGLIQNVNHLVYDATAENRYATFFYAQYDPAHRRLSYVNAGHNPPMLFHEREGEWRVERLEAGGTVVGLMPQFPYRQAAVDLAPGDVLVIYTDGVSEAMNHGDEEWGEERMMETAENCDGLGAAETIERIIQAADEFASGARQHDDMTLVVLRVLPPA